MIPRYNKPEMAKIWEDQNKFQSFLQAELAILESLEADIIPKGTAQKVRLQARINPERIDEIEATVRHDVIAFCTSITENLPVDIAKYFHFGVTSSDIIDTGMTLQIRQSLELVIGSLKKTCAALFDFSEKHKNLLCLGRSHGMYAEPMSFGGKFLGHYAEFSRRLQDYQDFFAKELTAQFSGAVGNYAIHKPSNENKAASKLGLLTEPVSTQIIPRDRLAKLVNIGGLLGSAIERLCVEIRHLHHSDINELHEGFKKGQKGSSTMPHKKNPISAENLSGMARVLRSHTMIAMENIVLWHERDISHSSAERLMLPDHFGILYYSLERLADTISNLEVHEEIVEGKVLKETTYLSSYYLHYLITKTSLKREDLYPLVQKAAFSAQEKKDGKEFARNLNQQLKEMKIDLTIPTLDEKLIREIYLSYAEEIFTRVLASYPLDR